MGAAHTEPTTEDASGQAVNRARLSPIAATLLQVLIRHQGWASRATDERNRGPRGGVRLLLHPAPNSILVLQWTLRLQSPPSAQNPFLPADEVLYEPEVLWEAVSPGPLPIWVLPPSPAPRTSVGSVCPWTPRVHHGRRLSTSPPQIGGRHLLITDTWLASPPRHHRLRRVPSPDLLPTLTKHLLRPEHIQLLLRPGSLKQIGRAISDSYGSEKLIRF